MITKPVRSWIMGFTIPLAALRLIISKPKLWVWAFFPFIVTVVLQYYLFSSLQSWIGSFAVWLSSLMGLAPSGILATLILWLSKILLFILSILTFSMLASLIASPFNDFLAEATEPFAIPALPAVPQYTWTFRIRMIGMDLAKTVFSIAALIVAMIFSWIPLLNILSFVFTVLLVTFQYVSYPQTRRGISLREGLSFLTRHFAASLGFGLAFTLLLAIPLLNAFILPLAVVGGTLLAARVQSPQQKDIQ